MTGACDEQAAVSAPSAIRADIRKFTVIKYRIESVGSTEFG